MVQKGIWYMLFRFFDVIMPPDEIELTTSATELTDSTYTSSILPWIILVGIILMLCATTIFVVKKIKSSQVSSASSTEESTF